MCLFILFLFCCRFLVRAGSNPGCSYHTCFSAFLSISNYAMADRVLVWTLTHFFKGGLVVSVCVVRPGLCAYLFLFLFFPHVGSKMRLLIFVRVLACFRARFHARKHKRPGFRTSAQKASPSKEKLAHNTNA